MSKGEQTRQVILDRATELARTVGLEALSIGALARETGLSKSGLFAHFGSKEALQLEVIAAAREQFVAEVLVPGIRAPRGEPRLRSLFARWLAWGDRDGGCIFVALAAELDDRPGPARDALAATQRDWLDNLATAARIAMDEGHLATADPDQLAFELYGIMLATHHLNRLLRDPRAAERAEQSFEALLDRYR